MRISQPAPLQGTMFPRRLAGTGDLPRAMQTAAAPKADTLTLSRPVRFSGWYNYRMTKEQVEQALKAVKPVDDVDKQGDTALTVAACNGLSDIVELLLDKGANVNHQNKDGNTALTFSARWGYHDIVKLLLARGANIYHQNNYGDTALTRAAQNRHTEIETLLKSAEEAQKAKAAEESQKAKATTATPQANLASSSTAPPHDPLAVKIPAKAKTAEEAQKAPPASLEDLLSACREGDTKRIHKLLKKNTLKEKPLLDGQTPLMAASGHGRLDAVRLLMNREADAHQQNQEGETALSKAAQGGHLTVISDLIAHGSHVSLEDIQALLAHIQPQEPPALTERGMTRLSRAAAMDNVEEIRRRVGKHLRRDGAEKLKQWLNKPDKQGLTPLMQAAKHGKLNAINVLLEAV